MFRLRPLLFTTLALLALTLGAVPPQADVPSRYVVVGLGTLGGDRSEAHGINEHGVVVGEAQTASGDTHAFLWKDGTLRDLGTLPGGTSSVARDVSDKEEAVGESTDAEGYRRATLWDSYGTLDLGTLGGSNSWANAINNNGIIVGAADLAEPANPRYPGYAAWAFRAEIRYASNGEDDVRRFVKTLPLPPVPLDEYYDEPVCSEATDVNGSGFIVGELFVSSWFGHATWPFAWRNGLIRVERWGDHDYWVRAVNRHQQRVGMDAPEGGDPTTGWVWRPGGRLRWIQKPVEGNRYDFRLDARSINDRGIYVGHVSGREGDWSKAFIGRSGRSGLISALLPRDSGWKIHTANAINNRGQIVGQGTYRGGPPQAVLLEPRR